MNERLGGLELCAERWFSMLCVAACTFETLPSGQFLKRQSMSICEGSCSAVKVASTDPPYMENLPPTLGSTCISQGTQTSSPPVIKKSARTHCSRGRRLDPIRSPLRQLRSCACMHAGCRMCLWTGADASMAKQASPEQGSARTPGRARRW